MQTIDPTRARDSRENLSTSYQWVDNENFENACTLVGRHTYLIGEESGRFSGRWNGIWTLPVKVADSVKFGIFDGKRIYLLCDHIKTFVTKLSHIERQYSIPDIGLEVMELMFIPEDRQGVCWRFVVTSNLYNKGLMFVVFCEFNLTWEAKQAGEVYRTKKEILVYNDKNFTISAKHYRYPDWVGILGANRQPTDMRLGMEGRRNSILGEADFGRIRLDYRIPDAEKEERFDIDLCLVGGPLSYSDAVNEFNECMMGLNEFAIQKTTIYEEYLTNTLELHHGDASLSRAFKWSKINLRMLEHYQPNFGTGLFAGFPHFAIYFGRDIGWSTHGLLAMGDFENARENLSLLAKFQARENGEDTLREPYYLGEIPHEIRTEGTIYYYSIDATPLFVTACKSYLDWTRDTNFIRYLYDNIVRAVEWTIQSDWDEDGLVDHGPEGFVIDTTWMDSYYRGKSAVDVQAISCRGLFDGAQLARRLGDESRAADWLSKAIRLKQLILEKYWNEKSGFFYDTIDTEGNPKPSLTINSIIPVLAGLTDEDVTKKVLNRIESPEFMTDWGVRTMSKNDPEYDPRSYQKGGVWPFCTGWVSRTDFNKGLYREGLANIGRFITGLDMGANYFKEVLYGDLPPTGKNPIQPTGCFIQGWSAGMFLSSIVEGLLGINPGVSDSSRIRITPYIGEQVRPLGISNVRIGDNYFDLRVRADRDVVNMEIVKRGPGLQTIESGFIISTQTLSNVEARDNSRSLIQNLNSVNNDGYLSCSFTTVLEEDQKKEFSLRLT